MNSTAVAIRRFEVQDHAAALALWNSTPGVGLSTADEYAAFARFLARNPGMSFVAEVGQEMIGTILCGHDGRRGLIHHLVVAEQHRRTGVALRLLRQGLSAM